jgi:predicted RNase H-like HicB family nuclease
MDIPVAIHKDEDSVYGVVVPGVPGYFSWGDSIDDALLNAREAIYSHVAVMIDEGLPVDLGHSKIEDFAQSDGYAGVAWALVQVGLRQRKAKSQLVNGGFSADHNESRSDSHLNSCSASSAPSALHSIDALIQVIELYKY